MSLNIFIVALLGISSGTGDNDRRCITGLVLDFTADVLLGVNLLAFAAIEMSFKFLVGGITGTSLNGNFES